MGTMIIKDKQFRPKFLQSLLTPKGTPPPPRETSLEYPRIGNTSVLSYNLLM